MEFLVMPQLADSLIECYSAPGSGCTHCNTILYCDCFNGAGCACNNGGGCTCNTGGPVIASLVITTVLASAYTPLIAQT